MGCTGSTAESVLQQYRKDLTNKVILITGPTSGIGLHTARVLASLGATVVLAGRSQAKLLQSVASITAAVPGPKLDTMELDLSNLSSVKAFANLFLSKYTRLDILICNAGVMLHPFALTPDGLEITFGTNHMGHFLLSELLLPLLKRSAPSRIILLSSQGHTFADLQKIAGNAPLRLDQLNCTDESAYSSLTAYALSKLCNALYARNLARRLQAEAKSNLSAAAPAAAASLGAQGNEATIGAGVTAVSVHPGAVATELGRYSSWGSCFYACCICCVRSPSQGAATSIYCALAPEVVAHSGEYFDSCEVGSASSSAKDDKLADELEALSRRFLQDKGFL